MGGGLYHYDGAGYATMTVPGTASIDSIYARSRTEVYFLRRFPTGLLLYDGRAFTEIAPPSGDFLISLQDVAGAQDGPVLIGGTGGAVLRLR